MFFLCLHPSQCSFHFHFISFSFFICILLNVLYISISSHFLSLSASFSMFFTTFFHLNFFLYLHPSECFFTFPFHLTYFLYLHPSQCSLIFSSFSPYLFICNILLLIPLPHYLLFLISNFLILPLIHLPHYLLFFNQQLSYSSLYPPSTLSTLF